MGEKGYRVSHASTRHQESYVIYFENKEFLVHVKDCKKQHKDYPEITEFEIIQRVNHYDEQKIGEIISEILNDTKAKKGGEESRKVT